MKRKFFPAIILLFQLFLLNACNGEDTLKLEAIVKNVTAQQLIGKVDKNEPLFLLDIRYAEDFAKSNVENALNIPFSEIEERMDELPKDKEIAIICYAGKASVQAADELLEKGYYPVIVEGGFKALEEANFAKIVTNSK